MRQQGFDRAGPAGFRYSTSRLTRESVAALGWVTESVLMELAGVSETNPAARDQFGVRQQRAALYTHLGTAAGCREPRTERTGFSPERSKRATQ